MKTFYLVIICYFLIINIFAAVLTVLDKNRAKKHKWRVPEATLLTVSALGGSLAMYITMRAIRHKTKHLKFMAGIPVIIFLQILLLAGLYILL